MRGHLLLEGTKTLGDESGKGGFAGRIEHYFEQDWAQKIPPEKLVGVYSGMQLGRQLDQVVSGLPSAIGGLLRVSRARERQATKRATPVRLAPMTGLIVLGGRSGPASPNWTGDTRNWGRLIDTLESDLDYMKPVAVELPRAPELTDEEYSRQDVLMGILRKRIETSMEGIFLSCDELTGGKPEFHTDTGHLNAKGHGLVTGQVLPIILAHFETQLPDVPLGA